MDGVNVRVYSPKSSTNKQKAIMVYYHGGGYTFGVKKRIAFFLQIEIHHYKLNYLFLRV